MTLSSLRRVLFDTSITIRQQLIDSLTLALCHKSRVSSKTLLSFLNTSGRLPQNIALSEAFIRVPSDFRLPSLRVLLTS